MRFSTFLCSLLVGAALLAAPAMAAYPTKDVRLVCWSAAGSSLDVMARTLAVEMEKSLKKPVVVENRVGGSGAVAMAYAMAQPADGHVLLTTTSSLSFTVAKGNVPFKVEDFVMLRAVEGEPSSVAVLKDSPIKTLDDFVEVMRKDSSKMRVGGYASAGFHQFVYYKLQQLGKFTGPWVPFDGGNQAVAALLGGHLDAAVITPSSALAQIESGEIRLLGISTDTRSDYFPNVPTMKEQGYDIVEYLWRGVMVKKGTPADVITTINAAIDTAVQSESWKNTAKARRQESLSYSTEELSAKAASEVQERKAFLQSIGLLKK